MTDKQLLESINQIVASQLEPIKMTQQEHSRILMEQSRILGEHSKILGEHSKILGEHSRDIRSLKGKVAKIDKTLNIAIKFFDEETITNRREIDRIKEHLGINSKH